ncbi:MAG: hypothetical protein C0493_07000 [Kytococcus sp.]|nr:hypothetical protein [Kytococcus sp.]
MTRNRDQDLIAHVRGVVERIQRAYALGTSQQPTAVGAAQVARLRRLDPGKPGDDPASWALVLDGIPASLVGGEAGDGTMQPSSGESAAHAAICLYAAHQQSHGDGVHERDARPGRAFGALARARAMGEQQRSPSVVAHIHAASTASTPSRRYFELRTLITLLRGERSPRITMDYGLLAQDLYRLADPRTAPSVRLAWGRDIHARPSDVPSPSQTPGDQ